MSLDAVQTQSPPIRDVDELLRVFREAEHPQGDLLIGLEHEKLMFPKGTAAPVPYEGPAGIGAVLAGFEALGWQPFREAPGLPVIAMTKGSATVSLEPGGQVELSGAPHRTARDAHAENLAHLADLKRIADGLGLQVVTLGLRPECGVADMPWMPKTRYRLMRQTLGARGSLAHHMMLLTATGQVSLDWRSEADCARKVTIASRISPLLVALYANSPVLEGRETGKLSFRSHVWSDVDPARCGYFPAMLDGSFSYRAYVDWALASPMLFLRRDGEYVDPKLTFGRFLEVGYAGRPAVFSDWIDHLSTLFPEVRIKKVIEIRSADGCDGAMTGGLAALMRGLFYDEQTLGRALERFPAPGFEAHRAAHAAAQVDGLQARFGTGTAQAAALDLLALVEDGLRRLDPADVPLLAPLWAVARSGRSPAHAVLEVFRNEKRPGGWPGRFAV